MLKRSIVISSPAHIVLRNSQLVIERKDDGAKSSLPIEDLSTVIIENQQVEISIPALNALTADNVGVILCNESHVPAAYIAPLESNSLQGERYRLQIDSSAPVKKSAWRQLIESKIENQSRLLLKLSKDGDILKPYYRNVKSDDIDNKEGTAARLYWRELFGPDFSRRRDGAAPNHLLNYGYSILRAVTIRCIVGAGMLPALGVHHRNRYNAFPLADDLMEPYRPYVDEVVYNLHQHGCTSLDKNARAALINVNYADVIINNLTHPLNIAVGITCTSLLKMMSGTSKTLQLPKFQ